MTDYTIPRRCRVVHHEKHPTSGGSLTIYEPDPRGPIWRAAADANAPMYHMEFDENGELVTTRIDPRTGRPLP